MKIIEGGKRIGKWIKHVTLTELKNAGLTEVQLFYALAHWLTEKKISDIARERNVTPAAVCLSLDLCQAKILKRRAEIIMGISPIIAASKKQPVHALPDAIVEAGGEPEKTELTEPVQLPKAAKLPPAKNANASSAKELEKPRPIKEAAASPNPEETLLAGEFVLENENVPGPSDEDLERIEAELFLRIIRKKL